MSDKIRYAKYSMAVDGMILKDGHIMFNQDIVSDLNRKSHLEQFKTTIEKITRYLISTYIVADEYHDDQDIAKKKVAEIFNRLMMEDK